MPEGLEGVSRLDPELKRPPWRVSVTATETPLVRGSHKSDTSMPSRVRRSSPRSVVLCVRYMDFSQERLDVDVWRKLVLFLRHGRRLDCDSAIEALRHDANERRPRNRPRTRRAGLAWKVQSRRRHLTTSSAPCFGPATLDALAARVGHVDRDAMWWVVEETVRLGLVSSTGEIEWGPDGLCGTSLPTVLALVRS